MIIQLSLARFYTASLALCSVHVPIRLLEQSLALVYSAAFFVLVSPPSQTERIQL